jgi:putative inorganic carbon (HCO3(-)) transporter
MHSQSGNGAAPAWIGVLHRKTGVGLTLLLLGISIMIGCGIAFGGLDAVPLILAAVAGLPVAYTIVAYPKAGICILLVLAYSIMFFTRFTSSFPLGTVMDGVEALLLFGFFLKKKSERGWATLRNSISVIVLIWIGYNLLEVANPTAASRLAWLYTIRTVAIVAVTYFIFLYHIRDVAFIRLLFRIWITLSVLAAAYTFVQEFAGFLPFEKEWLQSDPSYTSLYYIGNHWRKFSIFSDPVALAYNMVVSCIICLAFLSGTASIGKRLLLILLATLFFMAMLYSGTRGAFILLPIAFLLFGVLRFNRRILIVGILGALLLAGAILVPTSNPTLYRFQTAFRPSTDASYNIRTYNQTRIQPFILSHPMGGGLGSTGIWGQRFSPGSFLASFPPDSGYVRVAVELGWIGLLLFATLMFIILKTGIQTYLRIQNPELKRYCLAALLIVFTLNVGNYPQEALVQFPLNIFFYLAVALIPITGRLDQQLQSRLATEKTPHDA